MLYKLGKRKTQPKMLPDQWYDLSRLNLPVLFDVEPDHVDIFGHVVISRNGDSLPQGYRAAAVMRGEAFWVQTSWLVPCNYIEVFNAL